MNTALLDERATELQLDADTDTLLTRWCAGGRSEWEEAILRRELTSRGLSGLVLRDLASRRNQPLRSMGDPTNQPRHRSPIAYCRAMARRLGAMIWRARARRRIGSRIA